MAMAKLVLTVLAILSGTAFTVDAYLDSNAGEERSGYEMEMRLVPVSPDLLPLFETPCPQKLDTAADAEPVVEEALPAKSAAAKPKPRKRASKSTPRVTLARGKKCEVADSAERSRVEVKSVIETLAVPMMDDEGSF